MLTGAQQNITAVLDQAADDILKDFRCNSCGKIVFQYYGQTKLILPGQIDIQWLEIVGRPKLIQCKNRRFILLRNDYGQEREVEVKCKTLYFVIGW